MKQYSNPALEALELDILDSGVWGTIGPRSVSAAAALASFAGASRGLLCHSADAAYESLLRAFGCAHGDKIVTTDLCSPSHVLVAVCTGTAPLFCPADEEIPCLPDPDALDVLLTDGVRAVVADFASEQADTDRYPLDKLADVCRTHRVPLILDVGGCLKAKWRGQPLTAYCDAAVFNLGKGSELYAGMGGLVATDSEEIAAGAFAYHNCGRGPGDGCSLNFDEIVGGDFRVTEWTAGAAKLLLSQEAFAEAAPRLLCRMKEQPLYDTDYFRKMTGCR
ncbi:MAG: DegT/DnrJ/EryC1/StrS family aminotransferase [Clostridia bacterium]|nr:DegT/DnrJ/EryC1/StrS family aminotransferase [Clostridia bacterium]